MSTKETELTKDGLHAEKSSCSAKQTPGTAEADRVTSPVGETDAPGSLNLQFCGLDASPKQEATPFSSSLSKNHTFKFGNPSFGEILRKLP